MKKTLILLIMCAPMVMFSQTITKSKDGRTKTKTQERSSKEDPMTKEEYNNKQAQEKADSKAVKMVSDWIFVEAMYTPATGPSSIKVDLANAKDIILDKTILVGLNNASGMRYSGIAELFNMMGSIGFQPVTTYSIESRGVEEFHFIFQGENSEPVSQAPVRGAGNTMSRENPGVSTKKK